MPPKQTYFVLQIELTSPFPVFKRLELFSGYRLSVKLGTVKITPLPLKYFSYFSPLTAVKLALD